MILKDFLSFVRCSGRWKHQVLPAKLARMACNSMLAITRPTVQHHMLTRWLQHWVTEMNSSSVPSPTTVLPQHKHGPEQITFKTDSAGVQQDDQWIVTILKITPWNQLKNYLMKVLVDINLCQAGFRSLLFGADINALNSHGIPNSKKKKKNNSKWEFKRA